MVFWSGLETGGEVRRLPKMRVILKPTKRGYLECKICGWRRPLKGKKGTLRENELDDFKMRRRMWDSMLAYRYMTGDGPP